jgi:hypothetical protein
MTILQEIVAGRPGGRRIGVREAGKEAVMARRLGPTLAAIAVLALAGCRSIGRFPTIDPSDYAYSYFEGFYAQVFQFNAAQVESSALQALGDLGFTKIRRKPLGDGRVEIKCWTLDHRPACLWVKPCNEAMAVLTIYVGLIGDELVSQTVMERVAENFGTVPRVLIPIEPSLERRFNPTPPLQPTLPRTVSIPEARLFGEPLGRSSADEVRTSPVDVPVPPAPGLEPGPFGSPTLPVPTQTPPPPAPSPGT